MSGETRWSPGPWRRDPEKFDDLVDANGQRVVFGRLVLGAGYAGDREGQIEANTVLAESGPALYEALAELVERRERACRENGSNPSGTDGRYDRARAALRAARGETKETP